MSEKVTIPDMVALRDALNKLPKRLREGLEPEYAAAVTAAERLAKALAGLVLGKGVGWQEAMALLDDLYPNWREVL